MSPGLFDLSGRLALITGASRGIGLALARGLGGAGARVIVNARDAVAVGAAVEGLRTEGVDAAPCVFDVTDADAVEQALERCEAAHGPLDILINNAGVQHREPLLDVDEAAWRAVMATNVDAVFRVGRAAARRMVPRGRGKIVNIASLMSQAARPGTAPYAAAKGAVQMLTRAMCVEWAPFGLQVNAIGPGYFATELTRALSEDAEFNRWLIARTPARRWGAVDELVGAAVFLASDASSFVNGQTIFVDGGVLAGL